MRKNSDPLNFVKLDQRNIIDRVRQWAHSAARSGSRDDAWAQSTSTGVAAADPPPVSTPSQAHSIRFENGTVREKARSENTTSPVWARFSHTLKKICFSSWINVLLIFVPAGFAVNHAHVNPTIIFAVNAIAIVPLAGMLAYATESVAHRVGDTVGALLNVSFGNAVELIIL